MDLNGKRVLLSGGVKGLGKAILDLLLENGAQVAVFDIDQAGLNSLSDNPGVQCFYCDVSNVDEVTRTTQQCFETFGVPHVLINNAGILFSAPLVGIGAKGIEKHDVAMWHKVLGVNLNAVFYMTAHVVEKMITSRTKGVVVNISSISAMGNAGQSAYSAAKAAVNALTITWSKELGPMGIRVAAVAPGFSETESTRLALSESMLNETIKKVPLRRLAKPQEIASGVLWVIENDFYNGKILSLDGGLIV